VSDLAIFLLLLIYFSRSRFLYYSKIPTFVYSFTDCTSIPRVYISSHLSLRPEHSFRSVSLCFYVRVVTPASILPRSDHRFPRSRFRLTHEFLAFPSPKDQCKIRLTQSIIASVTAISTLSLYCNLFMPHLTVIWCYFIVATSKTGPITYWEF